MKSTSTAPAAVPQRCASPVAKVRDLAFVRVARRDLDRAERYYTDFGLTVSARNDDALYFRGALAPHHCWIVERGGDEFQGLGFTVGTREDLECLARLPGASPVHAGGEPGGGELVTLHDPSGTRVEVVFGMTELPELSVREPNTYNGHRPFDGAAPVEPINIADVELLAPITAPCRVICQGANYRQHMIESGVNPDDKQFNLLFMKSDATLAPPRGDVRVPAQVQLLDYELELGLVFGKPVSRPTTITADTLPDYVAALVMTNHVSARDIQLPQNQWFKGKSYRGFCPVGPVLSVLEPDDYPLLDQLELTLLVNERVRQHDSTANLVYRPLETFTELTQVSDLAPGDVLLTGTPSGCALRAPAPFVQRLMGLLPERVKWRAFIKAQKKRGAYLKPGDVVRSTIKSADRRIDLGQQLLRITWTRSTDNQDHGRRAVSHISGGTS